MNPKKRCNPGDVFGTFTILEPDGEMHYRTVCKCGHIKSYTAQYLRRVARLERIGKGRRCRICLRNEYEVSARKLEGTRTKYLLIEKFLGFDKDKGTATFQVRCRYGNSFVTERFNLHNRRSCGCQHHLPAGQGYTHPLSKMKHSEVKGYRTLHKTGLYTIHQLADMAGVTYQAMKNAIDRNSYKYVK